jgi:hypothetical protein
MDREIAADMPIPIPSIQSFPTTKAMLPALPRLWPPVDTQSELFHFSSWEALTTF